MLLSIVLVISDWIRLQSLTAFRPRFKDTKKYLLSTLKRFLHCHILIFGNLFPPPITAHFTAMKEPLMSRRWTTWQLVTVPTVVGRGMITGIKELVFLSRLWASERIPTASQVYTSLHSLCLCKYNSRSCIIDHGFAPRKHKHLVSCDKLHNVDANSA